MTINSVTEAHPLRDIRAELEAELFNDLDPVEYPGYDYYRRLPAPESAFPSVFVSNEKAPWHPAHEWHIETDANMTAGDVEEVEQLAAALQAAARQARIMNGTGRVYEVDGDYCRVKPTIGDQVYLVRQEERVRVEVAGSLGWLAGRAPGYTWGHDEPQFICTFLGTFEVIHVHWADGDRRLIVSEIPASVKGIDL